MNFEEQEEKQGPAGMLQSLDSDDDLSQGGGSGNGMETSIFH